MNTPAFHIGIASDPTCADWRNLEDNLDYLTRNRRLAGETIILHDLTPWGSTKIAMLWGTINRHPLYFTEDQMHMQYGSAVTIFDDLRSRRQLDAMVIFHNKTTPPLDNISSLRAEIGITARDINAEMHEFLTHVQQSRIPARLVPYDSTFDTYETNYPLRILEHGQNKSYGLNMRTGSLHAPDATREEVQHWLSHALGNFYAVGNFYTHEPVPNAYALDTLEYNSGWWNYSMHLNLPIN